MVLVLGAVLLGLSVLCVYAYDSVRDKWFPPPTPPPPPARMKVKVDMSQFPAGELMQLDGQEFVMQVGQTIVMAADGEAFMKIERMT